MESITKYRFNIKYFGQGSVKIEDGYYKDESILLEHGLGPILGKKEALRVAINWCLSEGAFALRMLTTTDTKSSQLENQTDQAYLDQPDKDENLIPIIKINELDELRILKSRSTKLSVRDSDELFKAEGFNLFAKRIESYSKLEKITDESYTVKSKLDKPSILIQNSDEDPSLRNVQSILESNLCLAIVFIILEKDDGEGVTPARPTRTLSPTVG
ncbi:MAG: hypothetical protein OHK0017_00290 [Patescibacteria group bacterium]